jgi:pyruvate dehydrogenase E1 component alpha subunit
MTRIPAIWPELYLRMLRIRIFEERVESLLAKGELPGVAHLSIGQEAAIVGACCATRPDDYMTGTHRSHGHPIGKGSALNGLMAELLGKSTGICKGKAGSMHLADFSVGSLGESGIVASAMPVAVGAALSATVRGTDQIVLCFFGDGGANAGAFHESLNLAAVWKLPVVFFCENNMYAVSVAMSKSTSVEDIAVRAAAYNMPGVIVDGQSVLDVYEAVVSAVARARSGGGPTLIEAKTYRYREHSSGTRIVGYRSDEEIEEWNRRDPIELFAAQLLADRVATRADLDEVRTTVTAEVEAATEFARTSPYPPVSAVFDDLYSRDDWSQPRGVAAK